MVAQRGMDRDIEERAGLLLPKPNRSAGILRPSHSQDIRRPLGGKLQQQKGRPHVRVLGLGRLDPPRDLVVRPDPIARSGRFKPEPGGLVDDNDPMISGDPETSLEHRSRLAPLECFAVALDEIDHGAPREG